MSGCTVEDEVTMSWLWAEGPEMEEWKGMLLGASAHAWRSAGWNGQSAVKRGRNGWSKHEAPAGQKRTACSTRQKPLHNQSAPAAESAKVRMQVAGRVERALRLGEG